MKTMLELPTVNPDPSCRWCRNGMHFLCERCGQKAHQTKGPDREYVYLWTCTVCHWIYA
jgi:hypothetical protein